MSEPTMIDDGGSAFPLSMFQLTDGRVTNGDGYGAGGMRLRDYFAAHVSDGEITLLEPSTIDSCKAFIGFASDAKWTTRDYMNLRQMVRYQIADAMIAARNAKP